MTTGLDHREGRTGDYRWYEVTAAIMKDDRNIDTIRFWVPEDRAGIFEIEGVFKTVVGLGFPAESYRLHPGTFANIYMQSPEEVLGDALEESIGIAMGPPRNPKWAQDKLDLWFRTSELLLQVDPGKTNDVALARETIRLRVVHPSKTMDYQERMPLGPDLRGDYIGRIDPLTTPAGSQAGLVYRVCHGSYVWNRRLVPGQGGDSSIFSKTMRECLVFPENTRPGRILIMRSNLASHEHLVKPEQPLVRHRSYRGNLSGVHLVTAVMHWTDNFADCIIVSQSAAEKMVCYRTKTLVRKDVGHITPTISEGDWVKPGDIVGTIDPAYNEAESKLKNIHVHNIYGPSEVTHLELLPTRVAGEPAWKLRASLRAVYPLETGDKIITRHGGKGVVKVIADEEMPQLPNGKRVECIVHPRSIYARRALGTIREMMVNNALAGSGQPREVDHFSSYLSMQDLIDLGLGKGTQLTVDGIRLGQETFVGHLFWLRCDKHTREILSTIGRSKPCNQHGRNPDVGKVSGQRMNVGMATVMIAKGMTNTYAEIARRNVEPEAVTMLSRALECI